VRISFIPLVGLLRVAIIVVVYDLPNRDCAALASNGELLIAQDGMTRYKAEYINPIRDILADAAFSNLRIVAVVEPDSIPNLITNLNVPQCAEANSTGAYMDGVRYAINTLRGSNVYMYLDIAHSGWLGWPSNFNAAIDRFVQLLTQAGAEPAPRASSIDGFISNTANYTPTEEIFLPDPNHNVGGTPVT
jgi:cellulase/cellobiase CelA1